MTSRIRTFAGALVAAGLMMTVPAAAETFNGPFVGAQAGWNHNKVGTLDLDYGDIGVHRSRDSLNLGIFAGFDHKVSPEFVLGAEAGFSMGIEDRMTGGGALATSVNPLYSFDISARAGYLLNDRSLFYVRGGYDNMRARTTVILPNGGVLTGKDSHDGWMVGGGYEHALGDNLSTRVEYRYSDLGSGFDRHQLLAGVAYRF